MKKLLTAMSVTCFGLLLAACGGGGGNPTVSNTPTPTPQVFPPVTGSYNIAVTFDGFDVSTANGQGVVQFVQASINRPELAGDCSIVVTIGSDTFVINTIRNASLTTSGSITFNVGKPTAPNPWAFNGAVTASAFSMLGTHTLGKGGANEFPGAWAAEKVIGTSSRDRSELFTRPAFLAHGASGAPGSVADLARAFRALAE
jgi:hypothetical protein